MRFFFCIFLYLHHDQLAFSAEPLTVYSISCSSPTHSIVSVHVDLFHVIRSICWEGLSYVKESRVLRFILSFSFIRLPPPFYLKG